MTTFQGKEKLNWKPIIFVGGTKSKSPVFERTFFLLSRFIWHWPHQELKFLINISIYCKWEVEEWFSASESPRAYLSSNCFSQKASNWCLIKCKPTWQIIFQVWSGKASYPNQKRARRRAGLWYGISSRQYKIFNLILVRKITNVQFLKKLNKWGSRQSLIRNYLPALFFMTITKML